MPIMFISHNDRGRHIPVQDGWCAFIPVDSEGLDIFDDGRAVFAPTFQVAFEAAQQRWGKQVQGMFRAQGEVCRHCGLVGGH